MFVSLKCWRLRPAWSRMCEERRCLRTAATSRTGSSTLVCPGSSSTTSRCTRSPRTPQKGTRATAKGTTTTTTTTKTAAGARPAARVADMRRTSSARVACTSERAPMV
eukprot:9206968-Pyramimonas_sp.AAC.1